MRKQKSELVKKAVQEYLNSNKTMKELASKYNISPTSISGYLKRNKISYKPKTNRKYTLDENYFEVIDTEEKAYFLGYLMADGCLKKTYKEKITMMSFSQSEENKKTVYLLKQALNTTKPVYKKINNKGFNKSDESFVYVLDIVSKKITSDLLKHGMSHKKENISRIPQMDRRLIKHFIRGYFDGDGSISVYNNKYGLQAEFSITSSSVSLLIEIQNYLSSELSLSLTKLKSYKK